MAQGATVLRASLASILKAIQSQLMTFTGFPVERVRISARWPDPLAAVGDQDLTIRPLGFKVQDKRNSRLETRVYRRIGVMIRTRLGTDYYESGQSWLTDPTLGHIPLEETVLDALLNFIPLDNKFIQNWLSIPLKLVGGEDPERQDEDSGNGVEILMFELEYMPPIDPNKFL